MYSLKSLIIGALFFAMFLLPVNFATLSAHGGGGGGGGHGGGGGGHAGWAGGGHGGWGGGHSGWGGGHGDWDHGGWGHGGWGGGYGGGYYGGYGAIGDPIYYGDDDYPASDIYYYGRAYPYVQGNVGIIPGVY